MTALIALLVLCQSPTLDAEVFLDRGETYIRAGGTSGLQVGSGLQVLDAKTRTPVGAAVVMEVWDALARINLDSKAAGHAPLKVVRVNRMSEPLPAPAPAVAEPSVPAPPAPPPVVRPPPQGVPALVGHVIINGSRLLITNSSDRDWHDCDIRLPDNRHYRQGDLDAHRDDGVMLFRFESDGSTLVPPSTGVTVICREGVGRFPVNL